MHRLFLLALALATSAFGMQRGQGWCEQGNQTIQVLTYTSSTATPVQASYPQCTIDVYVSGTGTHATIYSDNGVTPLANPFTATANGYWFFYAANGAYDIQFSGTGITTPFTLGAYTLFDINNYTPPTQVSGSDTQVQYNKAGVFGADANLTWNYTAELLTINNTSAVGGGTGLALNTTLPIGINAISLEKSGALKWGIYNNAASHFQIFDNTKPITIFDATPGGNLTLSPASGTMFVVGLPQVPAIVSSNGGFIQSSGGFLSTVNSWNGFNSNTDGANLRGYTVNQNTANNAGGYIDFAPVTYNPYNSTSTCFDYSGNPVQQPVPLNPITAFGAHNAIMWIGTSPQMPANGSCGAPLPVDLDYGLNINTYFFARGGLATDNPAYNAINTIYPGLGHPAGGITTDAITMGTLYPAGTMTTTGILGVATYLGGYIQTGHSAGVPAAGTIASTVNPLVAGDGLIQGTMYYDDLSNCENLYNGSSWACLGTGGSGGTPGGVTTNIQFNNAGAFGGSNNFTWINGSQQVRIGGVTATAALVATAGYIQAADGFNAPSATSYQAIQAPSGGVYAASLLALNYTQSGSGSADPSTPTTGQGSFGAGALFYNTTTNCERLYNGATWACIGTGGTGTPGGATTDVQFNSAGTFGGSANFVWDNTARALSVSGLSPTNAAIIAVQGYIQAATGFNAPTATSYQAIQAPLGGVYAQSLLALGYTQTGTYTGAAPPITTGQGTFGQGALSWSVTNACESVFNGATWLCLGTGGTGTPGGPTTSVQFNNGGVFGGSGNMEWDDVNKTLDVGTLPGGTGFGTSGFVQGNMGFNAPIGTSYNTIQAPAGGVYALSITANNYIQSGFGSAIPALTTGSSFVAGSMYYNTTNACEELFSGTSWACLASGSGSGVSALNSFTGGVTITGTVNQITVTSASNVINISLPASVVIPGAFNSTATGSSLSFENNNGTYSVQGTGIIQSSGGLNIFSLPNFNSIQTAGGILACSGGTCTGGQAITVGSSAVVGLSGGLTTLNIGSIGTFGGAIIANGGISTGSATNSSIFVGAAGNFYNRTTITSTSLSCSGVGNGWTAITSDNFVVVCESGTRLRAALTIF
jgi:hypothetical protein